MARANLTDTLMAEICNQIAAGKSLRSQLAETGISNGHFFASIEANSAWAEQYVRARETQADTLADQIVEIADDAVTDPDAASRRLRIDARKWVAAKLRPKRWGDSVTVAHEGAVEHKHSLDFTGLTAEQLRAIASVQIKETDK